MDFELSEDQKMLKETVTRFVDNEVVPRAAELDEEERFPEESFRDMAEMGLFGISIPEEHGGSGADFLSCVLVCEAVLLPGRDPGGGQGDADLWRLRVHQGISDREILP